MSKLMIVIEFLAIATGLILMGIMWVKNKVNNGVDYIASTRPVSYLATATRDVQQASMRQAELYIARRTPVKGTVSGDVKSPDQVIKG